MSVARYSSPPPILKPSPLPTVSPPPPQPTVPEALVPARQREVGKELVREARRQDPFLHAVVQQRPRITVPEALPGERMHVLGVGQQVPEVPPPPDGSRLIP